MDGNALGRRVGKGADTHKVSRRFPCSAVPTPHIATSLRVGMAHARLMNSPLRWTCAFAHPATKPYDGSPSLGAPSSSSSSLPATT